MNWLNLAALLIPIVAGLIRTAECAITGKGCGQQKKKVVTEGLALLCDGMISVSNGGQKETWEVFKRVAPSFIDPLVEIMNAGARILTGENLIDDAPSQAGSQCGTGGCFIENTMQVDHGGEA